MASKKTINGETFTFMTSEDLKSAIQHATNDKPQFIETYATKTGKVSARLAERGEEIITLIDNGTLVETKNKAPLEQAAYVVTNLIDGHKNEYIVKADKFHQLYEEIEHGVYAAKSKTPKLMYRVTENTTFKTSWGEDFNLYADGYLVPDGDGFYGINPKEFAATYSIDNSAPQSGPHTTSPQVRGMFDSWPKRDTSPAAEKALQD